MRVSDADDVERVGEIVHPDHPEDGGVLAERLRLFPPGCLVLEGERGVEGYAVAHPWRFGRPPKLNTLLGALPAGADTFYLHDLALLPAARGGRWGSAAVDRLAAVAETAGLRTLSLVAVGGSAGFWRRHGFAPVLQPDAAAALASYQGASFMARELS